MNPTKIAIVEDDAVISQMYRMKFEAEGYQVEVAPNGKLGVDLVEKMRPDIILLDIRMPEMSGLELQQELNRRGHQIPVVFVTGHGDVPMAVDAMKKGAFDFVQKPFRDQDLLDRVNRALQADAGLRQESAGKDEVFHRWETLTPREKEVMVLIVEGKANKVVASDLNLSERTVEIHRARVMEKMKVRSVAQLVKLSLLLPTLSK